MLRQVSFDLRLERSASLAITKRTRPVRGNVSVGVILIFSFTEAAFRDHTCMWLIIFMRCCTDQCRRKEVR